MAKSKKAKLLHSESPSRSIVKAISYRVLIIISIFLIAMITTGQFSQTVTITLVATISGTIIYYLHERAWSLVKWGRK